MINIGLKFTLIIAHYTEMDQYFSIKLNDFSTVYHLKSIKHKFAQFKFN